MQGQQTAPNPSPVPRGQARPSPPPGPANDSYFDKRFPAPPPVPQLPPSPPTGWAATKGTTQVVHRRSDADVMGLVIDVDEVFLVLQDAVLLAEEPDTGHVTETPAGTYRVPLSEIVGLQEVTYTR